MHAESLHLHACAIDLALPIGKAWPVSMKSRHATCSVFLECPSSLADLSCQVCWLKIAAPGNDKLQIHTCHDAAAFCSNAVIGSERLHMLPLNPHLPRAGFFLHFKAAACCRTC